MPASASDYFNKVGTPGSATFLASPGHTIGGTSFTVDSTSLWPTDTAVTFGIDTTSLVAGVVTRDTGSYTVWRGVVSSGTTIISCVLVYGTDQNYTAGTTTRVYILPTTSRENRLVDGLLIDHNNTGYHKTLSDSNGNEWIKQTATTSAVNELTVANAATGNPPILSATGGDTNIGLTLTPKGSGGLTLNGTTGSLTMNTDWSSWITNRLPAVSSVTENGNRSADITFASTVASLLTPGMRIRTSRTVAAPTGTILLNGTTQYGSKAAPAGVSFTVTYTCAAWVRLTSYQSGMVISRHDGATGWWLNINASGQIVLRAQAAGGAREVTSYQSVPLNKWVHVAASWELAGGTGVTYIDGVAVPSVNSGTAITSLTQAGSLMVGNSGVAAFFPGNVAQASVHSAVLTAAQIRAMKNQTISSSTTSIVSGFLLDQASGLNDVTANANNLTANGSPTYSTASPFTTDANGTPGGTYDWAIVTKVATTVATVQYPEGCAIPTSGGISTVDYSGVKAPFGMPVDKNRWQVLYIILVSSTQSAPVATTYYNPSSQSILAPVGKWDAYHDGGLDWGRVTTGNGDIFSFITTTAASATGYVQNSKVGGYAEFAAAGGGQRINEFHRSFQLDVTTATTYYRNVWTSLANMNAIGVRGDYTSEATICLTPSYL